MIRILTGENDVLRTNTLRNIVDSFTTEQSDMALERLDGEEASYDRMHEAVQSLPFLSSKKMVVLRRPSANKEFIEKFEIFLKDIADTNDVVIVEPKIDKRLGYYKTLKKLTGFTEFVALDGNGLRRDLIDYAKEQGGSISSDDARLLIDRFGVNQLALRHEIDKLISYAAHINRTSIELLTERTPQSSIFELLDAAFVGDTNKAMMLYHEQRSLKVEPQQIIAMLVWQLYILALIKTGGGRSVDEIALQAKISPFTVRKSFGLAHNLSLLRLKQHIADLREFDVRLKSEGILADEVVQYYLLRLGE